MQKDGSYSSSKHHLSRAVETYCNDSGMWTRLRGRGPFRGLRKILTGESRREYRKRLNGGWEKD